MDKFPAVFGKHVGNMFLVNNYSAIVGGNRTFSEDGEIIVRGSTQRSQDKFWLKDENSLTPTAARIKASRVGFVLVITTSTFSQKRSR